MFDRWEKIKIVISDFDGVLTDNRVLVSEDGTESVYVSRADGQAVHLLREFGIEMIILSTEKNKVVKMRADKMGVPCLYGIADKKEAMIRFCDENQYSLDEVCYIGNDVNDLEAMKLAGIKIVSADAYEEVKELADYITKAKGGYGVVREVAEIIRRERKNGK